MAGLKPCGTVAAYMRHRRDGENPCDACLEAKRLDSIQRRKDGGKPRATRKPKAKPFADSVTNANPAPTVKAEGRPAPAPSPAATPHGGVKPSEAGVVEVGLPKDLPTGERLVALRLDRLRGNLLVVDHALFQASPREVAALSKRRQELEEAIWMVLNKSAGKKDIVDELAKARADRQAKAKVGALPAVCN